MAGLQKIPNGYGDVFLVNTPALDKLGQQMYLEQKQREIRQQQENAFIDANIQKEIGKVRSVDTPDVINSYNQYKQLKKTLLFDKQLQRDPLAYNQIQQEANRAYQNIFTTANKSAELKEMQKNLSSARMKNPDIYADDFGQRMASLMNTPISGLDNHPVYGNELTNMDKYMYGGSNTNWADYLQKAAGQPKQVFADEKLLDGGLQTQITPYMYGNTPAQVKDYLLGTMGLHKTDRDAAYQWDHLTDKQIEDVTNAYQSIPKEKWKQMGLDGPQNVSPKNLDSKAEKYASYLAMQYAIANEPKQGTPVYRENKKATLDWQLNKDKIMEGIRHGNRMAEMSFRDQLKNKGDDEQNDMMDELYDNLKSDALKSPIKYTPAEGKPYNQYQLKVTPAIKTMFAVTDSKGHKIYPDDVRLSTDHTKVIPIFYEHYIDNKGNPTQEVVKNEKGESKALTDLSHPILESEFKQRWKKELMGAQAYGTSLKNKKAEKRSPSINYKIEGKTYTHDQLNKMGYDDNEIEQAIKAGIISK